MGADTAQFKPSQPLDSDYTVEHFLQLIKLVITRENGFYMLYMSRPYSTQHKETQWKNNNKQYSRRLSRRRGEYE